jgi:PTH1 family peptidyl-tRNA hydrolase
VLRFLFGRGRAKREDPEPERELGVADEPVKVILGLGNPGKEYERTRHNVGWWVVDHLADVWRIEGWKKDGDARVATGTVGGTKVRLVKPLTYMNLSGAVLRPYIRRPFWAASKDLIVIVDEAALPLGRYRFRAKGSAGGHNGLKSIEGALGTQEYSRLRIGIRPPVERRSVGDLSDFVLDNFGKAESEVVRGLFPELTNAIELWIRDGIVPVMNQFTGKDAGGENP